MTVVWHHMYTQFDQSSRVYLYVQDSPNMLDYGKYIASCALTWFSGLLF